MLAEPDALDALRDEVLAVMGAWKMKPDVWQLIGALPAMQGAELRPVIEIATQRYVIRRQPPDLTENDTRFRQAFMQHLLAQGIPVPPLLPRPDGTTYAVVEDGIYELQGWRDGQPYLSDGPAHEARLSAAAATLGALHQAAAEFSWRPHTWPDERSLAGLALSYLDLIGQGAERQEWPGSVRSGLRHLSEGLRGRIAQAAEALDVPPRPPALHIHGDYQPHNLRFDASGVSAIYDFDAARYDSRLAELAYSLLYFAGVRWDDVSGLTPPLVDDGMDILRVHAFLSAYGREAPPAEGEAALLADALALVFPVVFANGAAEDLIFPDDYEELPDEEDALLRIQWAEAFALWLDRYREMLAQAWEAGARSPAVRQTTE